MNKISPDFQLFFFFFILFCFSFNECQEVSLKLALAGVRTSVAPGTSGGFGGAGC